MPQMYTLSTPVASKTGLPITHNSTLGGELHEAAYSRLLRCPHFQHIAFSAEETTALARDFDTPRLAFVAREKG
jgi:hypothetical protein